MRASKKPIQLNLGCGVGLISGFVNVDVFFTREQLEEGARTKKGFCANACIEPNSEYVQADIAHMPMFPDGYADYVLMDNVIEHFPMKLVLPSLEEVHRVMKKGAKLVVVTPDFNCLARLWVLNVADKVGKFTDWELYDELAAPIYGNQIGAGEFHRVPMTPDYVNYVLLRTGFTKIKVQMFPMHQPGPRNGTWPGVRMKEGAVMRTDNIFAEAIKK